ncbi:MAG: C1 family peptidase [Chitinophagaceae bacterium]
MPIRMVNDPNDSGDEGYQYESNDNSSNYGGGNRGGNGWLIWILLQIFWRNPFLGLFIFIIGGLFMFGRGCRLANSQNNTTQYTTGSELNSKEFAKAKVYEPLDEALNNLPEAVSLQKFAPTPLNQGLQGSCVGWSSAYAARTIIEAISSQKNPNDIAFSPSFLYNQIKLNGCNGSYLINAMDKMTSIGSVPLKAFGYTDKDCEREPGNDLFQLAENYKMMGFSRLTAGEGTQKINVRAIKEHLAKDVPVVIGMMVGGSFMEEMKGKDVWQPTDDDFQQLGFGGHALCIIGYDDRKDGQGAFLLMNSWGTEWGNGGFAWVYYKDFVYFVKEAFGLHPLPTKATVLEQSLTCTIALLAGKEREPINFQPNKGWEFTTEKAILKGTSFKIQVQNNQPCFVYVIGKELNGKTYVLFPYPIDEEKGLTKFSPYCGITGNRVFPRGMSLYADEEGNEDEMMVIVANKELAIFDLNNFLNQQPFQPLNYKMKRYLAKETKAALNQANESNVNAVTVMLNKDENVTLNYCILKIRKQ